MIEFINVSKLYNGRKVVTNLSFKINKNEVFGIVGSNGAGKTTSFKMLLNLVKCDEGNIRFFENDISEIDVNKVGYLPEERSLLMDLTVYDQVKFFMGLKGIYNTTLIKNKLIMLINELEMKIDINQVIGKLSKGNQQKIQLISSIIHDPELIIFDEPFSGLDPLNVEILKKLILEMKKKGKTIIFSSHRLDHIEYFCDNILILNKGKSVYSGSLCSLIYESDYRYIKLIGDVDLSVYEQRGVLEISSDNKEKYILVVNEEVAKKIIKKLLLQPIKQISLEPISLQEIYIQKIKEANYV